MPPGIEGIDIHCPAAPSDCVGEEPSTHWTDKCSSGINPFELANVGFMYGTKYDMNEGREEYNGDGITAQVDICYPTDANAMDPERTWIDQARSTSPDQAVNGRGCHVSQDFGCYDGTCITSSDTACKCDFDAVKGADAGSHMVKSLSRFG